MEGDSNRNQISGCYNDQLTDSTSSAGEHIFNVKNSISLKFLKLSKKSFLDSMTFVVIECSVIFKAWIATHRL